MNKKGFASSAIIFGLLSVFLIAVSILLITVTNTSKVKSELNNNVVENIEYGSSTLNELEQKISELEDEINGLKNTSLDKIYPVGSIYMSTSISSTEAVADALGGGTWEKYSEGRMLIGAGTDESGNVYTAGATGGSTSVTLSIANLPAHTHTVTATGTVDSTFKGDNVTTSKAGSHTHLMYEYSANLYREAGKIGNPNFLAGVSGTNLSQVDNTNDKNTGSAGSHTHTVTATGTVDSTFKGNKVTTNSVGSGTSFSVQNPYTVVYMYKRTK